jgi:serine/threonine protein kinase
MSASAFTQLRRDFPDGVVTPTAFEVSDQIGAGDFGQVHRAVHRRSGEVVAFKEIVTDANLTQDQIDDYCREVRILWTTRWPFVLPLHGFTIVPPYAIVMPFVDGGSLYDFVRKDGAKRRLDPTQKTLVAAGVAYGMIGLHEANILHRNLKSRNILLDSRLLPFISDFGLARMVEGKNVSMTRGCGTANWSAPELLESFTYDNKVDVFSYGCILFELVAHQIPFDGLPPMKVSAEICHGKRPTFPSESKDKKIIELIRKCWDQDPKKRPTFREIYDKMIAGKTVWDGTQSKALKALTKLVAESHAEDGAPKKKAKK